LRVLAIPRADYAVFVLMAKNADASGIQREQSSGSRLKAQPAAGQDSEDVSMGKQRDIAIRGGSHFDDASRAFGNGFNSLTVGNVGLPYRPSGTFRANLPRRFAFEDSVVPFSKIARNLRALAKSRKVTRFARSRERACQNQCEFFSRQNFSKIYRAASARVSKRYVCSAGVLPR